MVFHSDRSGISLGPFIYSTHQYYAEAQTWCELKYPLAIGEGGYLGQQEHICAPVYTRGSVRT